MGESLAIIGSGLYCDWESVRRYVLHTLPGTILLVPGETYGVERVAEQVAKKRGMLVIRYLPRSDVISWAKRENPSWSRHRCFAMATQERNQRIARACDRLVAFWDEKSWGIASLIHYVQQLNKPLWLLR